MRLREDQGTFLLYSGATYVNFNRDCGGDLAKAFGRTAEGGLVTSSELHLNELSLALLTPQQRDFLLAKQHERDHFETYFSSPLGVLLFRCYQALATTSTWLFKSFFIPGSLDFQVAHGRPLKDWILGDGRGWILERINDGRIPVPGDYLELISPEERKRGIQWYLEEVVYPEIESVSMFLELLLHRAPPGYTLGRFVALANKVYEILSWRGDVPWNQAWTTNEPDLEMHPEKWDSVLSATELFEMSAMIRELDVLQELRADDEAIGCWRESYSESPYIEGMSLPGRVRVPMMLLDPLVRTALQSPCDIVYNAGGPMVVESLLPTWRFHDLLQVLVDQSEFPNPGDTIQERLNLLSAALQSSSAETEKVLTDLCRAPIPTWTDAYSTSGAKEMFGPKARMLPANAADYKVVDARYGIQHVVKTFQTCLGAAANHDWNTVSRVKEGILYCSDEATFPGATSVSQIPELVGFHVTVVVGYLQLAVLLEGIDSLVVPPFTKSMSSRIHRLTEGRDLGNLYDYVDAHFIAEMVFGKTFARGLRASLT